MDSLEKAIAKFANGIEYTVDDILIQRDEFPVKKYMTGKSYLHVHGDWEIKVPLIGELVVPLKTEKKILKFPQIYIIPPRVVHMGTDFNGKNEGLIVNFEKFEKSKLCIMYQSEKEFLTIGFSNEELSLLNRLCLGSWHELLERICEVNNSALAKAHKDCYLRSAINLLWSSLYQVRLKRVKSKCLDTYERAMIYIDRNFSNPALTVETIADVVGVTPNYLASLFQAREERSVRRSLIEARLKKAHELLLTGKYSVKETSYLTGWNSQLYFSNVFNNFYSYRPSELI